MTRSPLLAAAMALACTFALALGPPASAASAARTDKAGDAPAFIDITGLTVHNDSDRVVMTLDVPRLKSRGGFAFEYSATRYGGLYVFARKTGPGPSVQARYCGEVSCHAVRCAGIRVSWSTERHRVQATIPQRCFPAPLPSPGVFSASSGSKSDYDDAGALRVARG